MFGFGKKKLSDRVIVGIALEISMFDSWSIDHGFCGVQDSDREMFIERILKREGLSASEDEKSMISMGVLMNHDFNLLKEYRKKTHFDQQVVGFCRSINLPERYYEK
jgi:hypothetical protein